MLKPIREFTGMYAFLSNFAPSDISYENIFYPTVEHAFQAAKTLIPSWRLEIQNTPTPGLAKKLGRRLPMRPDWDVIKVGVMHSLLSLKFQPNFPLARSLEATGMCHLAEGNSWGDTFWGVDQNTGVGHNHLGRLLMFVRETNRSKDMQRSGGSYGMRMSEEESHG